MTKPDVQEFKAEAAKNMGEYVEIDGDDAVIAVGPYIVELYENILSRKARRERDSDTRPRGAVSVSENKTTDTRYAGRMYTMTLTMQKMPTAE